MEIKSCETCEYSYRNYCVDRKCGDCPMNRLNGGCKCDNYYPFASIHCPHYKKYEPTPSGNEISSKD